MILKLLGDLFRSTIVELETDSPKLFASYWRSSVSYNGAGHPYARAHDGKMIRLMRDGTTTDTSLYNTRWRHARGPDVSFAAPVSPRFRMESA